MRKSFRTIVGFLVMAGGTAFLFPAVGLGQDAAIAGPAKGLFVIGEIGPKAIDLKIRTQKSSNGESVVLLLRASRKAYITAIYVSPEGDATVIFPNKRQQENLVTPEKEYTLCGPDSGIQLRATDKSRNGKIVFYASSKPVEFDPLKVVSGQVCIQIPSSSAQDIEILAGKLREVAKDEGFNRIVLALKSAGKQGKALDLMGLPVKSQETQTVTGVEGRSEKVSVPGKE